MKLSALSIVAVLTTTACGGSSVVAPTSSARAPTPGPPNPPPPPTELIGIYAATLAASASCASALPPMARERTYTARFLLDGRIEWTADSLRPPPGHAPISSGKLEAGSLSFSIDVERDPQSDDFHGLWDILGNDTYLNISGSGSGAGDGARFTGTLKGVFAFYEPHVPPNPSVLIDGRYCSATDHRFTFEKQ